MVAAEAKCLHARTLSAIEVKYVSQVSSLKEELRSVVTAGCAACQAAYAQPGGPASSIEVVSQLRGIPRRLEEVTQYGLSTRVHMVLVIVGTIYADLNIGSIRGKPVDTDPLLYCWIQQ